MVGVGINIDNRKQLEEAARDAATSRATAHLVAQLEAAERIAKLGSWYWDAADNLVTMSVEMAQLLDCDDSMSGQEFRDALERVVDPDDVALLFYARRSACWPITRRSRSSSACTSAGHRGS